MCPGAAEYVNTQAGTAIFRVNASDCKVARHPRSRQGVVYGFCSDSTFCQFLVRVPRDMTVAVRIQAKRKKCKRGKWKSRLYNSWSQPLNSPSLVINTCGFPKSLTSTTNQMYVIHYKNPMLKMTFQAVPHTLTVVHETHIGGYITTLFQDLHCLTSVEVCENLTVRGDHAVMVSFVSMSNVQLLRSASLYLDREQRADLQPENYFFDDYKGEQIFNTEQLRTCVTLVPKADADNCFKMRFSFHPKHKVPQRLSSGLYNCSVDYFWAFQKHLNCNMKVECEDGRDEEKCDFSSVACQGWETRKPSGQARETKCYRLMSFLSKITPKRAMLECQIHGSRLASVRRKYEVKWFRSKTSTYNRVMAGLWFPGLTSKPFMYRQFFRWHDKTLLYTMTHIRVQVKFEELQHDSFFECHNGSGDRQNVKFYPVNKSVHHFLCEKSVTKKGLPEIDVTYLSTDHEVSSSRLKEQTLSVCPGSHLTHSFLTCDPKSRCGQSVCIFSNGTNGLTHRVAMYTCTKDNTVISYTLVCDFRNDCEDKSDESFCRHPPCRSFSCSNGQCVSNSRTCNDLPDCLDDSDENDCDAHTVDYDEAKFHDKHKLLIDLDGKGYFSYRLMDNSELCPDTHYRCATAMIHCLPIYTRCNELYDCPYHEDERECEDITCPGLYRCRDSTVCVHVDHVCDGWSQCPQRDDEWLCGMVCPPQCLCQGHAFLCPQSFSASLFPQLRYLDARGSGMTLGNLTNSFYLINLNLANCSIQFLPQMKLPNLANIDLSHNKIQSIAMDVFIKLQQLQVLILKGNPLTSLTSTVSDQQQGMLRTLDLSLTHLRMFDSEILLLAPGLQYLNISTCDIHAIGPHGFQSLHHMKQLDMSGNLIEEFPLDIFEGLINLELILSPDYRLCCDKLLPNKIPKAKCLAPQHSLSSCQNLFASDLHRLAFLFLSVLAGVCNVACLVSHWFLERNVCIFLTNLQCANLCMGIYTSVISAAHEMFRGQYVHYEQEWKASVACKAAGFVWLLSTQVSILTIFLFTVDLLIVLRFPLSRCRFSQMSAACACVVTWLVGVLLASLPLVPGLWHWGRYGQTGICSLVKHNMLHYQNDLDLFHCIVIANCLKHAAVSVGQAIVYRARPKHQILVETSMKHVCASVDLKMKIAVTDAMGWIAIATTNLLDRTGVTGLEKLNVFLSALVLPLNSVINPLLCLWHTVTYRQRQEEEDRLLCVLRSRSFCN